MFLNYSVTIILYGAPVTFLCDSVTLISACSSSSVSCYIWYSEEGPGRAASPRDLSSLYQM